MRLPKPQRPLLAAAPLLLMLVLIAIGLWSDRSTPGAGTPSALVDTPVTAAGSPTPAPTATPSAAPAETPTAVSGESATATPAAGLATPMPRVPEDEPATPSARAVYLPRVDQAGEAQELPPAVAVANTDALPPLQLADWPALSLADWPRPADDNGLCIHNLAEDYYDEANLDRQIARLQRMKMRWTLMLYADENQLAKAAPRFRDAGIMVVWRKMLRAPDRYNDWGRDIALLRELGVEPYMQVYNEPSLPAEWGDQPVDRARFLENFLSAVQQVYNAGGYVGLQFVSDDWLLAALQAIQERQGEAIFGRTFLVPHPYGLNHPPDYTEDANSVLSFLHQARLVEEQIGFVPPMIAGEGGWKWNAGDDNRFPSVDATLHRDYHLAVFDWFRTGVLSNGEPLPDTLFAFCPWLLSSKLDDSAWFDSFAGDHVATIEAVEALPQFVRRFGWAGG